MAQSFIAYKNDDIGFWISDSLLEVVCFYIVKAINERKNIPGWLHDMKSLLEKNSEGHFPSHMHLELPRYLDDFDRRDLFLEILNSTAELIREKGEEISAEELNAFAVKNIIQSSWENPLKTINVKKAINFLKDLIAEKLSIHVSDPVNYWTVIERTK